MRVAIIGAGHAGGTAAFLLRHHGFEGEIALIGEEPIAPYQRPPLSKAYLQGAMTPDSLKLKPESFYLAQNIDFMPGRRAVRLHRGRRSVEMEDGGEIAYDALILATGCRPRRLNLPGVDLPHVHMLRDYRDADRLRPALNGLVIIGGGYVGLEVAASAGGAIVLEREDRLLARVASPELSRFFADYHRSRGVEIRTNVSVREIAPDGVVTTDGKIACSAVLVSVGAEPNLELARQAGVDCQDGVVVDHAARTSDNAIFAIGDVTWRPLGNRMVRLESVPNALEQAKQAVAAILGRPAPPPEVPWFWSDQFDLKLQIAGLTFDAECRLSRGSPDAGKFAIFHLRGNRVLAVEAVNSPAEFMAGKKLIELGSIVDPERLRDPAISMKEVAAW